MGPVTTLLLCWFGAGVVIWALLGGWRRYPEAGDPVTPVTAPTVTVPPVTRDATAASRSKRYRARKRKKGRPS